MVKMLLTEEIYIATCQFSFLKPGWNILCNIDIYVYTQGHLGMSFLSVLLNTAI